MDRSILLTFAHPAYHKSRANRALLEAVQTLDRLTLNDLYETYPDFMIDAPREQELLTTHDILVFQHPFYWYSAPAHLKEWLDLVLTHGFAYGHEGKALVGKKWLNAVTVGGGATSYIPNGRDSFSVPELLRPFQATAGLCGCPWQEPFIVYGCHTISDAGLVEAAESYRAALIALRDAPSSVVPQPSPTHT